MTKNDYDYITSDCELDLDTCISYLETAEAQSTDESIWFALRSARIILKNIKDLAQPFLKDENNEVDKNDH